MVPKRKMKPPDLLKPLFSQVFCYLKLKTGTEWGDDEGSPRNQGAKPIKYPGDENEWVGGGGTGGHLHFGGYRDFMTTQSSSA